MCLEDSHTNVRWAKVFLFADVLQRRNVVQAERNSMLYRRYFCIFFCSFGCHDLYGLRLIGGWAKDSFVSIRGWAQQAAKTTAKWHGPNRATVSVVRLAWRWKRCRVRKDHHPIESHQGHLQNHEKQPNSSMKALFKIFKDI